MRERDRDNITMYGRSLGKGLCTVKGYVQYTSRMFSSQGKLSGIKLCTFERFLCTVIYKPGNLKVYFILHLTGFSCITVSRFAIAPPPWVTFDPEHICRWLINPFTHLWPFNIEHSPRHAFMYNLTYTTIHTIMSTIHMRWQSQ